jgi:predicted transcriptional regulator of viral defense system
MPPTSSAAHDGFLAALGKRLSFPPTTSLNPHCLSEHSLYRLFDELFEQGHRPWPTKEGTKQWLEEVGLLASIPLDKRSEHPSRRTRFYRMDIVQKANVQARPVELLQAYDENGVICYFSAVAFHALSTQPPAHHHVAIPVDAARKAVAQTSPPPHGEPHRSKTRQADPLGTWLFTRDGIPYYKTTREKRLLPGAQLRYIEASTVICITTLEQTLLDTLHKPLSCGGPAVVVEAWEQARSRVNEDRLADYLCAMDYLPIVQRVGFMMENLNHRPGKVLQAVLDGFLARLRPDDPSQRQQLFAGMKHDNLQFPWLVYVPS